MLVEFFFVSTRPLITVKEPSGLSEASKELGTKLKGNSEFVDRAT